MHRPLLLAALALALAPAAQAQHHPPLDWKRHTAVDTLEVLSTDEDGSTRETTIWIAVLDGQAYIRTGGSTWGDNVERDPQVVLRIGEEEIPVQAELVEDDALRERVTAVFREKYGSFDALVSLFRGARPRIMRLTAR